MGFLAILGKGESSIHFCCCNSSNTAFASFGCSAGICQLTQRPHAWVSTCMQCNNCLSQGLVDFQAFKQSRTGSTRYSSCCCKTAWTVPCFFCAACAVYVRQRVSGAPHFSSVNTACSMHCTRGSGRRAYVLHRQCMHTRVHAIGVTAARVVNDHATTMHSVHAFMQ